jgi:Polysaccharide deacetylase
LGGLAKLRPGRVAATAAAITALWAAPASADTVVSLTFDDGWANQLIGKPMLAEHDLNATYYIITGRVGNPGYLTWNEIAALHADGNEIGGHTVNHVDLTTPGLSEDEKRSEVCNARHALLAHGFPQVSFAYPKGEYDAASQQIVEECGYLSGRDASSIPLGEWQGAETIPPLDRWAIRTPGTIDKDDSLTDIQGFITDAEAIDAGNGSADAWVPLAFHHICDPVEDEACDLPEDEGGLDGQYITPSDFNGLLDFLETRGSLGTHVQTVAEVISGITEPPTSPPSQAQLGLRSIRSQAKGKTKIVFDVSGPGGLEAVDASGAKTSAVSAKKRRARIKPTSKFVPKAGRATLVIVPSKTGNRKLKRKGKLSVPVRVTFTPLSAGSPVSQTVKVKLRLKRRQR